MEKEAEKIIEEQVRKLPPEVREVLASDDLHRKITAIGEKHHLHIDQIGSLENEVTLVMMGLVNPVDLSQELANQLSLQVNDANAIASDVSQEIFLPIREAMKKMNDSAVEEKSVVMPSAAGAITPEPKPAISIPPKIVPPTTPAPIIPPAPAPKPADMHEAELMLSEPTVSMPKPAAPPVAAPVVPPVAPSSSAPATPAPAAPKAEPPKPAPYKADPYREPPE